MTTNQQKKHTCPDCKQCQGCSESRCRVCRGQGAPNPFEGMSLSEQIAMYEQLNQESGACSSIQALPMAKL
jgi:hypothetical protein